VPADMILEINSRIQLDRCPGVVLHHVLQRQMSIQPLQMIRQSVVGAVKIVTLVFDPDAKVYLSFNQKPMVITKIVVERISMAELGLLEIAVERVGRLVVEEVAMIVIRGRW